MGSNKLLFEAIAETRRELAYTKEFGDRASQLECFTRLITLYSALNVQVDNQVLTEIEARQKVA